MKVTGNKSFRTILTWLLFPLLWFLWIFAITDAPVYLFFPLLLTIALFTEIKRMAHLSDKGKRKIAIILSFCTLFSIGFGNYIDTQNFKESKIRGTKLALHLELYKEEFKTYPESLEKLPEYENLSSHTKGFLLQNTYIYKKINDSSYVLRFKEWTYNSDNGEWLYDD